MSHPTKVKNDTLTDLIADAFGWAVCMAFAAGFYSLGYILAPFFGGDQHRDTFGLLSAIVMIWTYEHRTAHERWESLKDRLDNLYEQPMPRL